MEPKSCKAVEKPLSPDAMKAFVQGVPQIVPESWCLRCKICCRFPDTVGVQVPVFSPAEAEWAQSSSGKELWFEALPGSPSLVPRLARSESGCQCPAFESETSTCSIYPVRPLDCRLYPFVLTEDRAGTRAVLSMDTKCPYLQEHGADPEVLEYAAHLGRYLETETALAYWKTNPGIVGPAWPEFISVAPLPSLSAKLQGEPRVPHPALRPLTLEEIPMLEESLHLRPHQGSAYTAAGLLGWKDLIRLWWARLDGNFCLFAEQGGGLFMPLPPLGEAFNPSAVRQAWQIMASANQGGSVSRIEGIEGADGGRFVSMGFRMAPAEPEYLYRREDLAALRGDPYRSQRWALNRLTRNFQVVLRSFQEKDLVPCLQLYTRWAIERQRSFGESFSKRLIRDGLFFHRRLMMSAGPLHLSGWVAEVEGKIGGYTFGGAVSGGTFCVFLEITDRRIPGLSQFLFREISSQLVSHPLINGMGDEGLPGLRRAKLSYRPMGEAVCLIASRSDAAVRSR